MLRAICLCLLFPFALQAEQQTVHHKIDNLVKKYVKKQGGGGMAVHVVYPKKGGLARENFFHGHAEGPDSPPANETSIQYIASVTKVFTATALAQFVKEGKIDLGDPVQKYLPANVHVPTYNGKQITILDLATNTGGLPDVNNMTTPFHYELEQFYAFVNQAKLTYAPGTKYKYSNMGFEFLGMIMARVANKSFGEVLKDVIFNPLKMNDSGFLPSFTKEQLSREVSFYKNGKIVDVVCCGKLPTLGGGGALLSTLENMSTFLHYNMGLLNTNLNDLLPILQKVYFHKAKHENMCLGWFKYALYKNGSVPMYWKDGGMKGVKTHIAFVKESRTGVVVLANNSNAKPGQLAKEILKLLNPESKH